MTESEAIIADAEHRTRFDRRDYAGTFVRSAVTRRLILRYYLDCTQVLSGEWQWRKRNGESITQDQAIAIVVHDRLER